MPKSNVFQNRGGVCFEVDVKDFVQPGPPPKISPPKTRKQPKVDPRA